MKLFDIFRKRAVPTSAITMQELPEARWSDRNYKAFADEGYRKNVIAYQSINKVSQGVANVRLSLKRKRPGMNADEEIFEHPILTLLAKPNQGQNYQSFTEAVMSYLMISGNSYVHAVGASGPPRELWPLRPDRMTVIPGKFRIPAGFQYSDNTTKQRFEVDQLSGDSPIMHMKTFNPLDDWYGMSPVEAAAHSVDLVNASSAWNLALLQNGARPSGAFIVENDGETLTSEQRDELKSELDRNYVGKTRAGRPMLLEGGIKWQEMSINPKDMDWIQGRSTSARDVALAYGVPPQLLGIPGDNTYSNYKEAKQAFYLDTVIPLSKAWAFYLNNWLVESFNDESLYLCPDVNSIEALEPMRAEKFTQVSGAGFLTINEKRELLGYGRYIEGEEEADVMLVPLGQATLKEVSKPVDDAADESSDDESMPADTEDYTGEPSGDALALPGGATSVSDTALNGAQVTSLVDLVARVAAGEIPRESAVQIVMVAFLLSEEEANQILGPAGDGFVPTSAEATPAPAAADKPKQNFDGMIAVMDGKAVNLSSARARERYRVEVINRRHKLEARFQTQLKAVWRKEAIAMAEAVDNIPVDLIEFVVEDVVSKHEPEMRSVLTTNIRRIMMTFGTDILDLPKHMTGIETKAADPKTRFESFLEQFIDNHVGERVQNLSKTTKRRVTRELRQVFNESLSEGDTPDRMVAAVKETYSGFTTSRAATVVRTETGVAQNEAQRSAAKALGIPDLRKTWISPRLPTSRDNHVAMHEHSVGINEKFEVPSEDGIDLMDGPGDASAPADQVINCHCVNVFGGKA